MGAPIIHFEIMGGNSDELDRFQTQGTGGINGGVGPAYDGNKRVTVYAKVDDLQGTLDKAERLGGKTILQPSDVPGGGKIAMFADPAGNITGLMQ